MNAVILNLFAVMPMTGTVGNSQQAFEGKGLMAKRVTYL